MKELDLVVRNARLVSSHGVDHCDIGVRGGIVAAIGDLAGTRAAQEYDCANLYVLPGLIDEHVHSRDPGLTHKEDFAHSTRAAAAGGVTTVLEMPNSVPPVIDVETFSFRSARLEKTAFVDFGLWGMILGEANRADLCDLAEAGVAGFKLFWGYGLDRGTRELVYNYTPDSDVLMPPDVGELYESFVAIAGTGRPIGLHAEQAEIIRRLTIREMNSGDRSYEALLRARPPFTEAIAIQSGIELAYAAGAHLHVLHIAAAEGVEVVAEARRRGRAVTAETCPHYLVLTAADFERAGNDMKIYPPVREVRHQRRLWQAITTGEIQSIGSDHAPHSREEKTGDLWSVPAGACGVQTMLPILLDAVSRGSLNIQTLVAVTATNPARIFGLYPRKGVIQIGSDADFTIVDLGRQITVRREDGLSKSPINPYHGMSLQGAPVAVFLRGQQIMRDGELIGQPRGRLLKPTSSACAYW